MKLIFLEVLICILSLIEAGIDDIQTIKASGEIKCCTNDTATLIEMSKSELCYPPFKAEIKLFEHSTILSDTLLDSLTINKSGKYSFTWTGQRIFQVDPRLRIFIECFDGTIFEQDYDFTYLELQPNII